MNVNVYVWVTPGAILFSTKLLIPLGNVFVSISVVAGSSTPLQVDPSTEHVNVYLISSFLENVFITSIKYTEYVIVSFPSFVTVNVFVYSVSLGRIFSPPITPPSSPPYTSLKLAVVTCIDLSFVLPFICVKKMHMLILLVLVIL